MFSLKKSLKLVRLTFFIPTYHQLDVVFMNFFSFLVTQVVPMLNCFGLHASDIIDALRPLEGKCGFLFSLVSDRTSCFTVECRYMFLCFVNSIDYNIVVMAST